MAGGGEMIAIERHVLAKLGQGRGRGARIDGEAQVADVGEALCRMDGHADGWMSPLDWPGHHREILHLVELTAIAEALLCPGQADDLERLIEAGAVLGHGHAESVELAGDRAPAHS